MTASERVWNVAMAAAFGIDNLKDNELSKETLMLLEQADGRTLQITITISPQ